MLVEKQRVLSLVFRYILFVERKIFPSSSLLMFLMNFLACLADEELQAEEETIEELRRKAEEERFRAQLEAQKREEERRLEEERR